jgi:hypothetical protein
MVLLLRFRRRIVLSLLFIGVMMTLALPVHASDANGLGVYGDRVIQVRYATRTCSGSLPFQTDGEPQLQVGSAVATTLMSQQLAVSCGQAKVRRIQWALGLVAVGLLILWGTRRSSNRESDTHGDLARVIAGVDG